MNIKLESNDIFFQIDNAIISTNYTAFIYSLWDQELRLD